MRSSADTWALAMEACLDREHDYLLAGDLAAMPGCSDEKSALIEASPDPWASPDPALLHRLEAKSHRNAKLLEAVGRGLKSAILRLTELRRLHANGATYAPETATGERGPKTLSRKA